MRVSPLAALLPVALAGCGHGTAPGDTSVADAGAEDSSAAPDGHGDGPGASDSSAAPDGHGGGQSDAQDDAQDASVQGTTIYAFGGPSSPPEDGAQPKGTLTATDASGTMVLYGRTAIGGIEGCGIIFSINPDGSNYQVLYRFAGSDGCDPRHDAMISNPSDGKLYATTQGVNQTLPNPPNTYGNWGQIFSFSPGAPIPTPIHAVHTFANPSPTKAPFDGAQQHSSFSIDPSSGILYGQSAAGGSGDQGMLYAVQPDGTGFTDLHDFKKADASDPHGRIVLAGGVLYGIAGAGGSSNFGAVYAYQLTAPPSGSAFTVLHTFAGGAKDGALSDHGYLTPVTVGSGTFFFGMTQCGGAGGGKDACGKSNGGGDGVIFQIDPTAAPGSHAAFSIAYSFQGTEMGDGASPFGSLLYDGTYLYGTTRVGGAYDGGVVFRLLPPSFGSTATPDILYAFGKSPNDGLNPIDNVIKVGDTLYGLTVNGGTSGPAPAGKGSGNGAIFAIPVPAH